MNPNRWKKRIALLSFLFAFFVLLTLATLRPARGIPSFARRYKTSCITCHTLFPKLTPVGEVFLKNGLRFPEGDEELVKEERLQLGSKHFRRVFPNAVYPGEISQIPPISIRTRGIAKVTNQGPAHSDFQFPTEIDLHSSGVLDEYFSYWVGAHLFEYGGQGAVIRAYLRGNDLLVKDLLDITIGQFEPAVVPFSSHCRLTITDYAVNTYIPGQTLGSHSHAGGNPFTFQRGIEVSGIFRDRLGYAVGLVNGNGGAAATASQFDENTTKDFYGRIEYKFGGTALSGAGMAHSPLSPGGHYWIDDSLKIGAFYYNGNSVTSSGGVLFNRRGVDANLFWGNLNLFGAYLLADDFIGHTNWFTEADYVLRPFAIGTFRYESVTPNRGSAISRIIPSLSLLFRPNAKLTGEGVLMDSGGTRAKSLLVGLEFAF